MKLKKLVFIILLALVGISYFIPIKEKSIVTIKAPVITLSQQLNTAANWKKWHPALKVSMEEDSAECKVDTDYELHKFTITTPQQIIEVKYPWAGRFEINIQNEGNANLYNVTLVAGKELASSSVIIEKKISLFNSFFSSAKHNSASNNFIRYLMAFVETDSLYYGFDINIQPVADSNVLSYKKQVPISEKFMVLPLMYKVLQDFIATNNLKILQAPMLVFSPIQKDSINVVTMLAVNKLAAKKSEVRGMKMPLKGRMLVGRFRGKYKNRIQLETAMQQYCQDKNILSIVSSYEKFTNNVIPANEETLVEMEIHFPIL